MLRKFETSDYIRLTRLLQELENALSEDIDAFGMDSPLSEKNRNSLDGCINLIFDFFHKLDTVFFGVYSGFSYFNLRILQINSSSKTIDVKYEIKTLMTSLHYTLQKELFLYMPKGQSLYYDQEDLFGIKDNFPEANEEIKLSGNCYATGNYTACVFHLMRAVEIVAKAMIKAMKAQKYIGSYKNVSGVKTFQKKPVELCDWKTLIDGLKKALSVLDDGSSTNIAKKNTVAFYSHSIAQFGYFKDAWRNIISHGHEIEPRRKVYLEGETTDIMNSTKHFMQHLAKRIKE